MFAKRLDRASSSIPKKKKKYIHLKINHNILTFYITSIILFIIIQIKIIIKRLLQNKIFTFFHIKNIYFSLFPAKHLLKPIKHISLNKPK
jgi:hypothetical protein